MKTLTNLLREETSMGPLAPARTYIELPGKAYHTILPGSIQEEIRENLKVFTLAAIIYAALC